MGSSKMTKSTVTVLIPTGALGAGVSADCIARGVASGIDAIACDAGSTDSGPSYLARGVSKVSRQSIKHDLAIMMSAARKAKVPLLIGSCGTAGTDSGVDWTAEIVMEIAREQNASPKIALLYSEQEAATIRRKLSEGKTRPLAPAQNLTTAEIDGCNHIVALMGAEPYIDAVRNGADIVLGGRTTDTAVLAAVPLMLGSPPGPAWHAAKTTECGSLCTVNPRGGGVLMRIDHGGFEIEPLDLDNRATPYTVSAHMLYENSDPFELTEPGGVLDVREAKYAAVDQRITRVTGSRWLERPYTMKLEGAGGGDFQSIMLIGIEDPKVLSSLDVFQERMLATLYKRVDAAVGAEAGAYDISLRVYGWNGVSGRPVPSGTTPPGEVGVLFVATAATQEMATLIAKTCNPIFFHFPLDVGMELPSYGFPFTPAEIERGQVFEFKLNHVVEVADGLELVRTNWIQAEVATETRVGHHA
jgi:Acyclic terpene utilisation family protein AtuA